MRLYPICYLVQYTKLLNLRISVVFLEENGVMSAFFGDSGEFPQPTVPVPTTQQPQQ